MNQLTIQNPFLKHLSSFIENDLTGWDDPKIDLIKSYASNSKTTQNQPHFLAHRKSISVHQKQRTKSINSRYMDPSLYKPKSPPKKNSRIFPKQIKENYTFIRKRSISQLGTLMKVLESLSLTNDSVQLPKVNRPSQRQSRNSPLSRKEKLFMTN